ncbi:family 78 glycoside hydrolase catalytic domain [Paenibacillus sp. PL91]|uniref:family 78 glycoside hydrolase catalytic domain n=1 Tax=Paenibacillus sp. PL91 TaxID=2729538 RepID=UPI00145F79A5|nr:family 78 glycoside hydrolase catalytic domain [Paenibacillus sp. PL91]MBC9202164.1 family 78 glycoside hydrolase catalytic domain [Paenibacillus sp. PL91]
MNHAWQANWIWTEGEESPRNEWHCFRKTFMVPLEGWSEGSLRITADSRYVLYVNGKRLGRGPVRSWPAEQSYDTYEVGHLLEPGKLNTIAVLVMHFGITTFYYIRGRGGLLAQLDLLREDGSVLETVSSDQSWRTARYLGQHSRSTRMACQHAFSEYVDGALWSDDWKEREYADSGWASAIVIAAVGEGPWTTLIPRYIPLLTEEQVFPKRVEALNKVKTFHWTAAIDVRNHLVAGSENHANHLECTGYAATLLQLEEPASVILGAAFGEGIVAATLNGKPIEAFGRKDVERYAELELDAGEHLLLVDVSGQSHPGIIHLGLYCEKPFAFRSPWESDEKEQSVFCSIGPFETAIHIDHQPKQPFNRQHPLYTEIIGSVASAGDLAGYADWVKPIPNKFVSEADVFALCVYKKESTALAIPAALQQLVIPNAEAGIVPIFNGADTEMVIDFGKEYSGYLTFEIDADAGTVIDFYGFEYMNSHFRQDTYGLDNTIRYVCRQGRQLYVSPIRRGFRYQMVTVRGAARPVKFYGLSCLQSNYPVAEVGNFQCADPLLNDIWQISQHTTKLCMEDTFVDCPAYEQVFWVGDSRNEALISNYLYGVNDIVKRCLRLVPGSKDQTPLLVNQVPSGWNSVIPNWTFFWALACHEYYLQTGDRDFAKEMYVHMKFTLKHYVDKIDGNGLFNIKGWNFLDWSPIDQPNDGVVAHQNMFLVKTLKAAAELAIIADDSAGADWLASEAEKLSTAINEHLWDETNQAYIDCIHADGRRSEVLSMQTQVVATLTEVAKGARHERLAQYMEQPPAHFIQIGSPFMSFFYYEALAKSGNAQQIVDDIRHHYGIMIDNGATTCWEMYPNFSENRAHEDLLTRSHCHAWSSAPAYFLGRELLGVKALTAAWTEVEIAPNLCGLAWAKGSVPHPGGGRIDVSWKVEQGGSAMKLEVSYPAHAKVSIRVPEGVTADIRETRLG